MIDYAEVYNSTGVSDLRKFYVFSRYKMPRLSLRSRYVNRGSDKVVVYFAFHRHDYVKMAFVSLLSFLDSTDIEDFDVKIVVNHSTHGMAKDLFGGLIGDESVVLTDVPQKYNVFCLPEFSNYKKVCFIDADGYFFSSDAHTNFFSDIFSDDNVLMIDSSDAVDKVLRERGLYESMSNKRIGDIDVEGLSLNGTWKLAGISMYPTFLFGDDYFAYSESKYVVDFACDETVIQNYLLGKCNIHPVQKYIDIALDRGYEDYIDIVTGQYKVKNRPIFVHPFGHGTSTHFVCIGVLDYIVAKHRDLSEN